MILDSSYFVGPLTIAQLGNTYVANDLTNQINIYEPEFLRAVLGYELYDAMTAGLAADSPDSKWTDLRDGAVFNLTTNFPGYFPQYYRRTWLMNQTRKTKWVGLTVNTDAGDTSPLAAYVYWKYMRNLITQASGSGIVKTDAENATTGVSDLSMRGAWNRMCDQVAVLWFFMAAKGSSVYSDYDYRNINFYQFRKQNMFNL